MQNNMQRLFSLIVCLIGGVTSIPQFITFKDGKVGVNFLGYHAEAGLGGGQDNSQGLFGGLHASAGTPWGQNAAAGLGGNTNGRSSGLLYAGAQATPDIGASTILGGDTETGGFHGAEAHTAGHVTSKMSSSFISPPPSPMAIAANHEDNAIQQIPNKNIGTIIDKQRNEDIAAAKDDENVTKMLSVKENSYIVRQRNKYRQRQNRRQNYQQQQPHNLLLQRRYQRDRISHKTVYKINKPHQ